MPEKIKLEVRPPIEKPKEKEPFDKAQDKPVIEVWKNEGGAVERIDKNLRRRQKKQKIVDQLIGMKRSEMNKLHLSLKRLDEGEPVNEFRDETRRIIYFDEESQQYFTEEGGSRKNIGLGDIVSDYAWGIKYVPDGEMVEPAYRTLAKRVLVNEARRDIEKLYNRELMPFKGRKKDVGFSYERFNRRFQNADEPEREKLMGQFGFITEIAVRELLSRITINNNLDFTVLRATIEEDRDFKYDFKVEAKQRARGVNVERTNSKKSIGFQLKAVLSRKNPFIGRYRKGKKIEVDEVLILKVPGYAFIKAYKTWVDSGEPSGGPEQFLSPELKKAVLKAVTQKLVEIPQEVLDKIE